TCALPISISQVLILAQAKEMSSELNKFSGGFLKGVKKVLKYPFTVLRSAFIGVSFGVVPALGIDAASFFAYITEKRAAKKDADRFGKGDYRGVIAPETANNAVVGGSLIPTLALGIPGSTAAAV